jgi:hypothetical protein
MRRIAGQLLDEWDDTERAVEPNPPRVVVVVALREVVDVELRLLSGTEVDRVAEVDVREKIGRDQWLLLLLLVRVHDER